MAAKRGWDRLRSAVSRMKEGASATPPGSIWMGLWLLPVVSLRSTTG
jgi:hypothetical protein